MLSHTYASNLKAATDYCQQRNIPLTLTQNDLEPRTNIRDALPVSQFYPEPTIISDYCRYSVCAVSHTGSVFNSYGMLRGNWEHLPEQYTIAAIRYQKLTFLYAVQVL